MSTRHGIVVAALLAGWVGAVSVSRAAPPDATPVIVIQNATILTVTRAAFRFPPSRTLLKFLIPTMWTFTAILPAA